MVNIFFWQFLTFSYIYLHFQCRSFTCNSEILCVIATFYLSKDVEDYFYHWMAAIRFDNVPVFLQQSTLMCSVLHYKTENVIYILSTHGKVSMLDLNERTDIVLPNTNFMNMVSCKQLEEKHYFCWIFYWLCVNFIQSSKLKQFYFNLIILNSC